MIFKYFFFHLKLSKLTCFFVLICKLCILLYIMLLIVQVHNFIIFRQKFMYDFKTLLFSFENVWFLFKNT